MSNIIALGGGGFSMEDTPALDDWLLEVTRTATGTARPRICFIPTASGDSDDYIVRFYAAFTKKDCTPTHLPLFRRKTTDLTSLLCGQDAVYVGGGNTANMMACWRAHGVDVALREAHNAGVVMAGISAGAICWFEGGVTDSFGTGLAEYTEGLGLLRGSCCPHYDGEEERRPAYRRLVDEGALPPGIALDDGCAAHFLDGVLHELVTSRSEAQGYAVGATEEARGARVLGSERRE